MSNSQIVLSAGVRQNLLSLQNTSQLMGLTQNRLATGKKVNTALDNPVNFFTSSTLQARAGDLSSLLDSMSNGIKALEAADNGLTSITSAVQSMQSTLRQSRQDKSFKFASYAINVPAPPTGTEIMSFSGGSIGAVPVNVDLTNAQGVLTGGNYANIDIAEATDSLSFSLAVNGSSTTTPITITKGTNANTLKITVGSAVTDNIAVVSGAAVTGAEMASALTTAFGAAGLDVGVTGSTGNPLVFTAGANLAGSSSTAAVTMTNFAFTNGGAGTAIAAAQFGFAVSAPGVSAGGAASTTGIVAKTVDQLVATLKATTALAGKVTVSNDSGNVRIQNLSTADLITTGMNAAGQISGGGSTAAIGGNDVRKSLVNQFNTLRDQLDKFTDDFYYNGVNLLRGDKLKLVFNETGVSSLEIQAKDQNGNPIAVDNVYLQIQSVTAPDFDLDTNIDSMLDKVSKALEALRAQASNFGSNLSIVQNRQDFTKRMINTLQTGADGLVLADQNEESANMLALQTRQQLSTTALSLSAQADQAVLRLFQ